MIKSDYPDNLPISRKAYDGFVDRIRSILGKTFEGDFMVQALNDYLRGGDSYKWGLDFTYRLVFEFLRQDIDKAIERSRKARERAAMRRIRKAESVAVVEPCAADVAVSVAETVSGTVASEYHHKAAEAEVKTSRRVKRGAMSAVVSGCDGQSVNGADAGCRDSQSGLLSSTERRARRERTCISVGV